MLSSTGDFLALALIRRPQSEEGAAQGELGRCHSITRVGFWTSALVCRRTANQVAIAVLDDAKELEKRLAKNDHDFNDMLEQTDHLLKQVAVYVESQQIYNLVRTIQQRIQARGDAELAKLMTVVSEEDAEFKELMDLI